jgi:O-antigen/teichoic acid export membrane protein
MIRTLARDTLLYGVSAILSRGLSLFVLPIYTRILSPVEYGALDIVMVIGSFATLLVSLEITQALARFYQETEGEAAKRRMASTVLWFTAAAYALAGAGAILAAEPLATWLLGSADMAGILRIGFLGIVASGFFYLVQNQLRFALRSKAFAVISLVYAFATLALGVLLGYGVGLGLAGVLWGLFMGTAAAAALGLWLLRDSYRLEYDGPLLRTMLAFSMPLVPSALATFLTLYSNRMILNGLEGLYAVGVFGVAARVASVITLLTIGLQSALTPLIYAHHREPGTPRQLARLVEGFSAAALGCCLALGLFAWEILALFVERRYMGAAPLVLFLAPATLLGHMYIFFPGIPIAKRTRLQLLIFTVTAAATAALNWLLIEVADLSGAAVATLLASVLFISLWTLASQRLYPIPISWSRILGGSGLFVAAGAGGLWIEASEISGGATIAAKAALLLLFGLGTIACGLVRRAELAGLTRRMLRRPAV